MFVQAHREKHETDGRGFLRKFTLLCALLLGGFAAAAQAASVTLAWNASTGANVAGYRLHQGTASGLYTNHINVGNATSATVPGLLTGVTYFFSVTAYDANNAESAYCTEVSYTPSASLPPVVGLTSPAAGASFTAPATVPLSASVTPNGQTIAKVQFFNGSVLIGEDTTAPYSFSWGNVAAGTYSVSAKAVYGAGLTVASASVNISVSSASTPPVIVLTAPANNSSFTAPATVNLAASVTPNGHTITKVQFYNGSSLLGEDTAAPYSYTASSIPVGTYSIKATAVYDAGSTVSSAVATVNVTSSSSTNTVPTLPAPWRSVNIGSPGATGSASITNGIYTVAGAGNIGGAADSFRFLYQPLTADGEIRAQIRSAQSTGAAPLAGVMMRETLTPGSKYALLAVRPNGTLYQQYRATTGASSVSAAAGTAVPPNAWVRLVRTGSMFYAYYSTDNVTWRLVNSGTIPMASTIYFGFAVSSGSTAVLNTSTFRSSLIVP